jgi:hypothetical protein
MLVIVLGTVFAVAIFGILYIVMQRDLNPKPPPPRQSARVRPLAEYYERAPDDRTYINQSGAASPSASESPPSMSSPVPWLQVLRPISFIALIALVGVPAYLYIYDFSQTPAKLATSEFKRVQKAVKPPNAPYDSPSAPFGP